MEACASAHYWGREIAALGHEVRLVPPIYVKPFVKRHKNDAADAEAITEAAQRPTMHFVAVKTEAQQAQGMLFRTRDLLVRQRTQTINALRGHLAEYGVVAPQGRARIRELVGVLEDGDCGLPEAVVELGRLLLGRIDELDEKVNGLDRELRTSARENEETARLMTIPGVGPVTAMALQAFAPPMESFRRGRDFSAWLGLVPRQHTTGGKPRLGRISKMGQQDLRRLLVTGAMFGYSAHGPARRDRGSVAGRDAGAQAEEGGRGGARQQNGAGGLGAEHERGDLPDPRCRLTERRKERSDRQRSYPGRCGQQDARNGVRANGRQDGVGKTSKQRRASSPLSRFGSDLTNTIRARGQHTPHQEAGHTTVPDQTATDSVRKSGLPNQGASTYGVSGTE